MIVGVARLGSDGLVELLVDVVEVARPGRLKIDIKISSLNSITSQVNLVHIDLTRVTIGLIDDSFK